MRRRDLLKFGLDHHLYGERARQGRVVFFDPPLGTDLRELKTNVRHAIGPMLFYRVEYRGLADVCFTSFVHIPDADRVAPECRLLGAHGIMPSIQAA